MVSSIISYLKAVIVNQHELLERIVELENRISVIEDEYIDDQK